MKGFREVLLGGATAVVLAVILSSTGQWWHDATSTVLSTEAQIAAAAALIVSGLAVGYVAAARWVSPIAGGTAATSLLIATVPQLTGWFSYPDVLGFSLQRLGTWPTTYLTIGILSLFAVRRARARLFGPGAEDRTASVAKKNQP